ncbi:hypothetical protein ACEE31_12615, partial [Staphylococcus simulans]
ALSPSPLVGRFRFVLRTDLLAPKNGLFNKSELGLFKTTRFNKPFIAMKLKEDAVVINVMRIDAPQLLTVITHTGMSLTYSSDELSSTVLRAAGVKSINLKDDDYVVMTKVVQPDNTILLATPRGAVKQIGYKIIADTKRAQRGI